MNAVGKLYSHSFFFHYSLYNSPSIQDNNNSSTNESPNCLAGVIKSLQEALHSIGGRVVVVSASHASSGYGRLSRGREKVNLYGTKEEISLYGYGSTVIQVFFVRLLVFYMFTSRYMLSYCGNVCLFLFLHAFFVLLLFIPHRERRWG